MIAATIVGLLALVALVSALAVVVVQEREQAQRDEDARQLRNRLQTARLLVEALLDIPNPAAASLAQAWLREEDALATDVVAALAARGGAEGRGPR